MNLTCLPSGKESIGHNFVEIVAGQRGCSSGPGMWVRDLAGKLLILLHDRCRHRGCMAALSDAAPGDGLSGFVDGQPDCLASPWSTAPASKPGSNSCGNLDAATGQNHKEGQTPEQATSNRAFGVSEPRSESGSETQSDQAFL